MKLSIIVLLAEPLAAPADTMRHLCRSRFDAEVEIGPRSGADQGSQPAAQHPSYQRGEISRGGQRFSLEYSEQPCPEPGTDSPHRAFWKFAWVEREPVPEFLDLFGPLASLAAAACDGPAVALYQPYWERLIPLDADTVHDLEGDQPLRAFGILHGKLGCLLREESRWKSVFPTRWGPVEIDAFGGPLGPPVDATDRMREIVEHRLRGYRARLMVSLLYRPCRVVLDERGEISVEFRNWLTGSRGHYVSERDVHA